MCFKMKWLVVKQENYLSQYFAGFLISKKIGKLCTVAGDVLFSLGVGFTATTKDNSKLNK